MKSHSVTIVALVTLAALPIDAEAQDAAAQANNPLAQVTAFNVQGYYIDELTEIDENATQFILRYAKPLSLGDSQWLVRASMPFNDFPVGPTLSHRSGPGDFDIFAAYLIDSANPAVSFGIGPQLVLPTATPNELGSEQWQIGLANVYFNASSAAFQYGYLAIYRTGIGETNDRDRVNLLAFQPFAFLQMGNGWYTGTAPVWSYDFEGDNYTIPVGARLGKVFRSGNSVFNVFIEPQISVLDDGPGLPERQWFFAVNMQF